MDIFLRTRVLLSVIVVLVLLNGALVVMLWTGHPGQAPAPPAGGGADREPLRIEHLLRDELNFTPSQIDRYLALRRAHQARMRALSDTMRFLKDRMFRGVLESASPELSDSLFALTTRTQLEIERATFRHLLDLKEICTGEQRGKLGALIHEMFGRKPKADDAPPPND